MKILAIDTSCDDTSVAISEDLNILGNVFWSKIKTHSKWGGVVPSVAKRQHEMFLDPAIEEVVKRSKVNLSDIDYFAVTKGPGLAIALEAGINKTKELAKTYKKPVVAVNHMIGHIYANLTRDAHGIPYSHLSGFNFPLLALTVSGGHTDLYILNNYFEFKHIGSTLDDAIGEAFDKVGRVLGMGFPAGPKIEQAAKQGNEKKYKFPRPLSNQDNYNWSYSGLKTAVLYQVRKMAGDYEAKPTKKKFKLEDASKLLTKKQINDIAASFQKAAIDSLLIKLEKAIGDVDARMLVVGGGVVSNSNLRKELKKLSTKYSIPVYFPKELWLCTDNAAMIATAAYFYIKHNEFINDLDNLDRDPTLQINFT